MEKYIRNYNALYKCVPDEEIGYEVYLFNPLTNDWIDDKWAYGHEALMTGEYESEVAPEEVKKVQEEIIENFKEYKQSLSKDEYEELIERFN